MIIISISISDDTKLRTIRNMTKLNKLNKKLNKK